ncbi:MAG: HD domain-containing protein, partial [Promethearchaeota archaeon]
CKQIAARLEDKNKINKNLLEIAVYLHDIGRNPLISEKNHSENHAVISAALVTKFLKAKHIDPEPIAALTHIIRAHSFSLGESADNLEAQILSDADKLSQFPVNWHNL